MDELDTPRVGWSPRWKGEMLGLGRRRPTPPEEIAFAVRKLLEVGGTPPAARLCPGTTSSGANPAFLELIEQVTAPRRDAPLLLCCMARPELLDLHSRLGGRPAARRQLPAQGLNRAET